MITIKQLRWANAFSYGKDNKINFDGIYMDNYFEIEREYGLINKMTEQVKTDKKNLGNIQKIRQKIENFTLREGFWRHDLKMTKK
mgnify:CR=1 FL=1